MLMSAIPLEVSISDLVIETVVFASGQTAEIYQASYHGSAVIFKKPIEDGAFAIGGVSQEQQLLLSAAISQIYGKFLPEHALVYSLVKDGAGRPVGLMAPFVEMSRIVANDDEDGASLVKTRSDIAPALFTARFGYLLALAYCLRENDLNGGNFVMTETGVMKIDHDRSLSPEEDFMPYRFALNEEAFSYFPFFEKTHQYSPETFIHNTDYNLVKVFKEYLCDASSPQYAQGKDFIRGMADGFRAFAARAMLVAELRAELLPLFSGSEQALLEALLSRVAARQELVGDAVRCGYADHIAEAYCAPVISRPASLSAASSEGLPSTSPSTVGSACALLEGASASGSQASIAACSSPPLTATPLFSLIDAREGAPFGFLRANASAPGI